MSREGNDIEDRGSQNLVLLSDWTKARKQKIEKVQADTVGVMEPVIHHATNLMRFMMRAKDRMDGFEKEHPRVFNNLFNQFETEMQRDHWVMLRALDQVE